MINVHRHATEPLPSLVLVDTDRNVATYANIHYLTFDYECITNYGGWEVADKVGDCICSYNDFRYLYPEYFI